jgi:hypothetical protein
MLPLSNPIISLVKIDPGFPIRAHTKVKPVDTTTGDLNQRRLTTMFTILFALLLTAISPASVPSHTTTTAPTAAAASGYNCYCHDIGHKDWGK